MAADLTFADLQREAASARLDVTAHQLKRLRREGLVARPDQRHEIGHAGSTAVYPDAAVDQLMGVLRLRKAHDYCTFRELRVAAWLDGFTVNFELLRPDVVDLLRTGLSGLRHLTRGGGDDQLSRRLAGIPISRSAQVSAYKAAVDPVPIQAVLLTVLQLLANTRDSSMASETFDEVFEYENEMSLSDAYTELGIPGTPKWPRIVSRASNKWFVVGHEWLKLMSTILNDHRQAINDLQPSSATSLALKDLRDQLSDRSPSGLEVRNLIACQGIVLAKTDPERLLKIFDPSD